MRNIIDKILNRIVFEINDKIINTYPALLGAHSLATNVVRYICTRGAIGQFILPLYLKTNCEKRFPVIIQIFSYPCYLDVIIRSIV